MSKVYIYRIDEQFSPGLDEILPLLTEERRNKALGYLNLNDRLESAYSYLLLKYAYLQENIAIDSIKMEYKNNEKPYFKNQSITFNITHSYPYVAVGISINEIGIDLEKKSIRTKIAKRFFTKLENKVLDKNDDNGFTRLWCLKEAILKNNGLGIAGGLDKYDFSSNYLKNEFNQEFDNLKYYFKIEDLNDYVLAIASLDKDIEVINIITEELIKKS